MKRPALGVLLAVQTVVLVLVAWAAVYFARDEFLLATAKPDDTPDAAPLAEGDDGVPTVRLGALAQRNVGIVTAPLQPTELAGSTEVPVVVLDVQALVELHGKLQAARHDAEAARTAAAASAAERKRVQALFDDDRNASQRVLDAAIAQAAADQARERGAQSALAALGDGARAAWGAQVAGWLDANAAAAGPLARLLSGRDVLLRASLRSDDAVPPNAPLQVQPPGRAAGDAPIAATPLGIAAPADAGSGGGGVRSLLYRATPAGVGSLAPGMRLQGRLATSAAQETGALVPASAIVWHAGQPWIYIRESGRKDDAAGGKDDDDDDAPRKPAAGTNKAASAVAPAAAIGPPQAASASAQAPASAPAAKATDSFQRRAVPLARRIGDQWFLPGFTEDDPVVVRGAQVLLSEELRFQIRNENDD